MIAALTLLQLCDSFFPTGMFAHSLGLEGMVRRGRVRSLDELEQFLLATLTHAVIPSDGVALLNSHRGVRSEDLNELCAIDTRLSLMNAAPELRAASQQHGRRLLAETADLVDNETLAHYRSRVVGRESPGSGAVALGAIGGAMDVDAELALAGYLHGYVTGVTSAAIRLLPLSNSECQAMVHRLHPFIADRVQSVRDRSWREMAAFSPDLVIISMNHPHDDLRMFAS
jgi:urease accessory protein